MFWKIVKFIAEVTVVLGALACILQYLQVKPTDVRGYMHIGWPGWMWLVTALLLFAIGSGMSGYDLWMSIVANNGLKKQLSVLESDLDRWKRQSDALVGEHSEKLRQVNAAFDLRTAEYVKHVSREKNQALEELTKKHADEISTLKRDWEKHAAELVKQAVTPSRQEQPVSLFPSLSALHDKQPEVNFNAKEYFRTAYFSPVTAEIEQNMKIVAHQYDPQNPEVFYTRLIGVGAAAYHYDLTWAIIFKSQLDLLAELNRTAKRVSIAVARKYFDEAAGKYPNIYPRYDFDGWFGYIQGRSLVVRYPSNTKDIPDAIEITHAGRDFLKFLAHWGRDVNTKKA
jgi:hypothetical protein